MFTALALLSGVAACTVGGLLLRTWLSHGGGSGTTHFRRSQVLAHASVGVAGVGLVVLHVVTTPDDGSGWAAAGVLFTASTLGATMFLPWWWRGRRGRYGNDDPAGFFPAEDHFTFRAVNAHGLLADLTWVLMLAAVLVD